MKIQNHKADAFLKSLPADVRLVLFFGSDEGVARERLKTLQKQLLGGAPDPFAVIDLKATDVKDDTARLCDEYAALSLLGGPRVITLGGADDDLVDAVKNVLDHPSPQGNRILLQGDNLPPSSKLRALCEKSDLAAAIGCYADEGRDLINLIRQTLLDHNKTISPDALNWLQENLSGNRMLVKNELDKLLTYAYESSKIELSHVRAVLDSSSEAEGENAAFACFSGDFAALDRDLTKLLDSGAQPVWFILALSRHLQKLLQSRYVFEETGDLSKALEAQRPPLFFKVKDRFAAQVRSLSLDTLLAMNDLLLKMDRQCKTTGLPAHVMVRAGAFKICGLTRKSTV